MTNIKIFVSYKEKHKIIKTDIIQPIQTGRAITNEIFEGMIGDDTGDNISKDNERYNELSAQYWVWKNYDKIGNPDYVGFMHYRRHLLFDDEKLRPKNRYLNHPNWYVFSMLDDSYMDFLDSKKIKEQLLNCDCLLPKIYDYNNYQFKTIIDDYKHLIYQNVEHLYLMINLVKEIYPEYAAVADDVLYGHKKYIANMFVMSKNMFFEYSEFLFNIEREVDRRIDSTYYSSGELRFLGYLGEILLTIFILQCKKLGKYNIKELDASFIESVEETYLQPAFKNNNIPIAMSSSNMYVPYLSVCLQSLKAHNNNLYNYDIVVFTSEIPVQTQNILKEQIQTKNISLRFFNPKPLFDNIKLYISHEYFKEECYYRLVSPLIFKNYKKIIFTDIDLLFCDDLVELYNFDLQEKPMAACIDLIWHGIINRNPELKDIYSLKTLALDDPYTYVNTGVIVLDVQKCMELNFVNAVLKLVQSTNYKTQEQDAINSFFKNNIAYLETCWNVATRPGWIKDIINYMPKISRIAFENSWENPKIIHYLGGVKPWLVPEEDMAYLWWNYARISPFYELCIKNLCSYLIGDFQIHNSAVRNYYKNCLNYWKCKLFKNFTWNKKRQHYIDKAARIKEKIRLAKRYK